MILIINTYLFVYLQYFIVYLLSMYNCVMYIYRHIYLPFRDELTSEIFNIVSIDSLFLTSMQHIFSYSEYIYKLIIDL